MGVIGISTTLLKVFWLLLMILNSLVLILIILGFLHSIIFILKAPMFLKFVSLSLQWKITSVRFAILPLTSSFFVFQICLLTVDITCHHVSSSDSSLELWIALPMSLTSYAFMKAMSCTKEFFTLPMTSSSWGSNS